VQNPEYQPTDDFTPVFGKTPDIKVAGSSTNTHPVHELPLPEDELALEEQFLSCQGEKAPEFIDERSPEHVLPLKEGVRINSEGKELANFQELPDFSQVNNALKVLGQVLPEDHPDIVNLSNVADSLTALGLDNSQQVKPYEIGQTLDTMNSYNAPGRVEDSLRGPQQPLDDQTQPGPEALDDQAQDQSGLETVVDSEMAQLSPGPQMPAAGQPEMDTGYGPDTGMDEVNQAMDNAMQTPAQQPDPVKTQQQYIEEAMYMQNYMMPGQMQMSPGFGPMPRPQI
jgi:hypothetical protein